MHNVSLALVAAVTLTAVATCRERAVPVHPAICDPNSVQICSHLSTSASDVACAGTDGVDHNSYHGFAGEFIECGSTGPFIPENADVIPGKCAGRVRMPSAERLHDDHTMLEVIEAATACFYLPNRPFGYSISFEDAADHCADRPGDSAPERIKRIFSGTSATAATHWFGGPPWAGFNYEFGGWNCRDARDDQIGDRYSPAPEDPEGGVERPAGCSDGDAAGQAGSSAEPPSSGTDLSCPATDARTRSN